MAKKMVPVFFVFIVAMQFVMMQVYSIIIRDDYVTVVENQGSYTLTVSKTRGTIYDCKMRPLAGGVAQNRASAAPSSIDLETLKNELPESETENISENLKKRYPFAFTTRNENLKADGILLFKTTERYDETFHAVHTVGYLDGAGKTGLTGIERAYNSLLSDMSGEIKVTYQIDARGGVLAGFEPEIKNTVSKSRGGVVLTIDKDIQRVTEEAAGEYLKTGAVVVMEVPSGNIRAMVSTPAFSPLDIASVLDDENSPLINRTLSAYDLGSIFKLVTSAAALECGLAPDTAYECQGRIDIGNNTFRCMNHAIHGMVDMEQALSKSCNLYFIQLANEIGADRLLKTAKILGFGKEIQLAPGYSASAGKLPGETLLEKPAALANFSFGQGELLSTPIQIASMVGTIASKGMFVTPRLVEKTIDEYGQAIDVPLITQSHMAIGENTARQLSKFMHVTVAEGTGSHGTPDFTTAAAKTGTAETGMKKNGKKVLQAWYAGFFPYEKPEYVCIVLAENGASGGQTAGPVFKAIADGINLLED